MTRPDKKTIEEAAAPVGTTLFPEQRNVAVAASMSARLGWLESFLRDWRHLRPGDIVVFQVLERRFGS